MKIIHMTLKKNYPLRKEIRLKILWTMTLVIYKCTLKRENTIFKKKILFTFVSVDGIQNQLIKKYLKLIRKEETIVCGWKKRLKRNSYDKTKMSNGQFNLI